MAITLTTQINPVAANAGLQQNISVSSPSSTYFASGGSGAIPAGETGPGWANVSNTPSPGANAAVVASTSALSGNWPIYLLMLALAWFGLQHLKG